MFKIVSKTLSGDLAASGTTTFNYPASTDEDSFASWGHMAIAIGNVLSSPADFTLTFASASVTFTYASGKTTIPAGSVLTLQMNLPGEDAQKAPKLTVDHDHVSLMGLVRVDLGSPLIADVDRICEAQDLTAGGTATLTSTIVDLSTGAGAAPFGRCLTVDVSAGTSSEVVTITGTNYLGEVIVENITLNGTTVVAGKKAFATVTSVVVAGDTDGDLIVGDAVLLGLPVFIEDVDEWVTELQDGTTATAGAFVAGVSSAPTATTGDVRGTYSPNTPPDGALHFVLYMAISDPAYTGQTDFVG
jgi:hypothetical protein